jgi:hypothetical protein
MIHLLFGSLLQGFSPRFKPAPSFKVIGASNDFTQTKFTSVLRKRSQVSASYPRHICSCTTAICAITFLCNCVVESDLQSLYSRDSHSSSQCSHWRIGWMGAIAHGHWDSSIQKDDGVAVPKKVVSLIHGPSSRAVLTFSPLNGTKGRLEGIGTFKCAMAHGVVFLSIQYRTVFMCIAVDLRMCSERYCSFFHLRFTAKSSKLDLFQINRSVLMILDFE